MKKCYLAFIDCNSPVGEAKNTPTASPADTFSPKRYPGYDTKLY